MMTSLQLGVIVGLIPTVAMILSSILLTNIEVKPSVEACFQNFAAGLMLAAGKCQLCWFQRLTCCVLLHHF